MCSICLVKGNGVLNFLTRYVYTRLSNYQPYILKLFLREFKERNGLSDQRWSSCSSSCSTLSYRWFLGPDLPSSKLCRIHCQNKSPMKWPCCAIGSWNLTFCSVFTVGNLTTCSSAIFLEKVILHWIALWPFSVWPTKWILKVLVVCRRVWKKGGSYFGKAEESYRH